MIRMPANEPPSSLLHHRPSTVFVEELAWRTRHLHCLGSQKHCLEHIAATCGETHIRVHEPVSGAQLWQFFKTGLHVCG